MRLTKHARIFEVGSLTLVGNLQTGYLIGLTSVGADICRRLEIGKADEDDIRSADKNLLTHLRRGGFLSEDASVRQPKSGYLHVTARCNLSCTGCYSFRPENTRRSDLPLHEVVAAIEKMALAGVDRIVISGGEPFLREDLADIAACAKRVFGMSFVDVLTNGTLITMEALQKLAPHVDRVCISFDGASPSDPSPIRGEQRFSKLAAVVGMIQEAGIRAHILPTLHAGNIHEMGRYSKLASDLGATLSFSVFSPPRGFKDDQGISFDETSLKEFARELLRVGCGGEEPGCAPFAAKGLSVGFSCGAGCSTMSVDASGFAYPCHMLHYPEFRLGKAASKGTSNALPHKSFSCPTVDEIGGCSSCEIRYLCRGGCRARAYALNGSISAKDPYCTLIKVFYLELLKEIESKTSMREVA